MQGWIKLHRKLIESPLYKDLNSVQRDVMINILLNVNHKPNKWIYKGEEYEIQAGQMITSLKSLKEMCAKDVTIQNIRTALVKLEKYKFLTNESTNKDRLITVVNWGFYQYEEENQQANSQATNKQLTTNKNDKNNKENKTWLCDDTFNLVCLKFPLIEYEELNRAMIKSKVEDYLVYNFISDINSDTSNIINPIGFIIAGAKEELKGAI